MVSARASNLSKANRRRSWSAVVAVEKLNCTLQNYESAIQSDYYQNNSLERKKATIFYFSSLLTDLELAKNHFFSLAKKMIFCSLKQLKLTVIDR